MHYSVKCERCIRADEKKIIVRDMFCRSSSFLLLFSYSFFFQIES